MVKHPINIRKTSKLIFHKDFNYNIIGTQKGQIDSQIYNLNKRYQNQIYILE